MAGAGGERAPRHRYRHRSPDLGLFVDRLGDQQLARLGCEQRGGLADAASADMFLDHGRRVLDTAYLIERLGPNPSQNPELGLQFMERNREAISGSTWYELEHFTSATMEETLEEVGFVNVRVSFAASTLARTMWQRVKDSELTDSQTKAVLQGVADMAVRLDAGQHEVLFAYQPPRYKKVLFLVTCLIVALCPVMALTKALFSKRRSTQAG